ncbi:MAG: hypothetical protein M3067_08030 [Chloroflexota bacterium]|nr:hypothetical protein [Chloroflexota bacterium]
MDFRTVSEALRRFKILGVGSRLVALAVVTSLLAACSATGNTATPAPSATGGAAPSPSIPSAGPFGQGPVLTAASDGLTLTVQLDRWEVEPGGKVVAHVAVRNDRPGPMTDSMGCLLAPRWNVKVPVPADPRGADWNGIAGRFKEYVLTQGYQPGIVSAFRPYDTSPRENPCPASPASLGHGETAEWTLAWPAEIVPGIPAMVGTDAFTIVVGYRLEPDAPPTPVGTGPGASRLLLYQSLSVGGSLKVVGDGGRALSAGQAIDALLKDRRFVSWLGKQPASTWSVANIFLENSPAGAGIIPAGPVWEIDLFREVNIKRNWAIGFVDAYNGMVRGLTFCNIPCNR